jgi:hypothetical protein
MYTLRPTEELRPSSLSFSRTKGAQIAVTEGRRRSTSTRLAAAAALVKETSCLAAARLCFQPLAAAAALFQDD